MVSCAGTTKMKVEPERYTKAEVDSKLDSLNQQIEQSFGLLTGKLAETDSLTRANRDEFRNYRKNLTAIQIPDSVYFCGQRIPLERQDVRQRFEKQIYFFIDDQAQLVMYKQRSNVFFPVIEGLLSDSLMPTDLKYVAVIESALKPNARSRSKAQGFWQFISSTAKVYGLPHNEFVDLRNNLAVSTIGAINFFSKLHLQFDDWFLALAAYNMGENGLAGRISEQGTRDYFELVLPQETENYVFRAAAVKLILEDPGRYGIPQDEIVPWEASETDTVSVTVKSRLKVRWVADWCGTTYRQIKLLNTEVRDDTWGPGKYIINVPVGTREQFYQGLKDLKSGKYISK